MGKPAPAPRPEPFTPLALPRSEGKPLVLELRDDVLYGGMDTDSKFASRLVSKRDSSAAQKLRRILLAICERSSASVEDIATSAGLVSGATLNTDIYNLRHAFQNKLVTKVRKNAGKARYAIDMTEAQRFLTARSFEQFQRFRRT